MSALTAPWLARALETSRVRGGVLYWASRGGPWRFGYKKCRGGKVVQLRIVGPNNERDAPHHLRAFRCRRAVVVAVYQATDRGLERVVPQLTNAHVAASATSRFASHVVYREGSVVEEPLFDRTDHRLQHTFGIHYYRTLGELRAHEGEEGRNE